MPPRVWGWGHLVIGAQTAIQCNSCSDSASCFLLPAPNPFWRERQYPADHEALMSLVSESEAVTFGEGVAAAGR